MPRTLITPGTGFRKQLITDICTLLTLRCVVDSDRQTEIWGQEWGGGGALGTSGNSFGTDCVGKVKLHGNRHVIGIVIPIVLSTVLMLRLLLLLAVMMLPWN